MAIENEETRKDFAIADAIAVSVNVSLRECVTGDEIVKILHSGKLPKNRISHIGIMFAEIHPSEIAELLIAHNISFKEARKLYSITPHFYHNSRMEDFLYGNMGKIT